MERKVIIVDSATNSKVTVTTDATTFGELKNAAAAAGVSYSGKDWLEGLTKTTPVSDDALLPTNVPYKGGVTNDLVFMLTNTNKQIKSGAELSRYELMHALKAMGLAPVLRDKYHMSYTNLPTNVLLEEYNNAIAGDEEESCEECEYVDKYNNLVEGIAAMLVAVGPDTCHHIIEVTNEMIGTLRDNADKVRSVEITDEDIKNIFA